MSTAERPESPSAEGTAAQNRPSVLPAHGICWAIAGSMPAIASWMTNYTNAGRGAWWFIPWLAFAGGYSGWFGYSYLGWQPVLTLFGIISGFGCLVGFCVWWVRPRDQFRRSWLLLLILLFGYGLAGALALAPLLAACALAIVLCVGWITSDLLRVLAGAIIGVVLGSYSAWAFRKRYKAVSRRFQTEDARADSNPAAGSAADQGGTTKNAKIGDILK